MSAAVLGFACGLSAIAAGCDVGSPSENAASRGADRPPLQLGVVEATTNYTADGRPIYQQLLEEEVTSDVSLSASFTLYFDRFLLPHKIIRQSVCLRPSTEEVASLADCVEPFQVFTEPEYNPVLRQVTYRLPAGARLEADTTYRLTVFVAESLEAQGFFAFDGAALARSYSFTFQTRSAGDVEFDEPLPSPERYCAAVNCFDACTQTLIDCIDACPVTPPDPPDQACVDACNQANDTCRTPCEPLCVEPSCLNDGRIYTDRGIFGGCAFGGCHSPDQGNPTNAGIASNLDLRDSAAIRDTAIGQTSHFSQQGEGADIPDNSPIRFGRAMPIIAPSNPGNSYLMYKLIINTNNYVNASGATPIDPVLVSEIGRLRDSVVVGLPMPTEGGIIPKSLVDGDNGPDFAASQQLMLHINTWIAHGAVLDCADVTTP